MEIPDETWARIKLAIYEGKKIEAIKLYREASGIGLKEAKDFIEKTEVEMREKEPERFVKPAGSSGCMGAILFACLEGTVLYLILNHYK